MLNQRKAAPAVPIAVGTDFQAELPSGLYRSISTKMSGAYTASGAGTDAGDVGFNLQGRTEVRRGGEAIINMFGPEYRWLTAFTTSSPTPILPASIAASGVHLATSEIAFDALMPGAAIDARGAEVIVGGKFGTIAQLGTTVLTVAGNLLVGGETTEPLENGDHFEPRFLSQTVDTSSASSELKAIKRIGNPVELLHAVMIRCYDASTNLTDPDAYRSDGMVRRIRIEVESGGQVTEIYRGTWGEAKMNSTTRAQMAAASVPGGVVIIPVRDPSKVARRWGNRIRLVKNDTLTVYLDTLSTVEGEFTALAPASGDQAIVTPLCFVPRGPGVDAARRKVAGG